MIIEVGHVVAGLVAVRVLADHACDVGLVAAMHFAACIEQQVEPGAEAVYAAYQVAELVDVLGYEEAVLPSVRFCIVEVHLEGIEGLGEAAVPAGAEELGPRIQQVLPVA